MSVSGIKTLNQLGNLTRAFITRLEVLGATKYRVDEWTLTVQHGQFPANPVVNFRFNYAHAEQRIHVMVDGLDSLMVSINLGNEPKWYPDPLEVIATALMVRANTPGKVMTVGWDLGMPNPPLCRDGFEPGVVPDGATVVD